MASIKEIARNVILGTSLLGGGAIGGQIIIDNIRPASAGSTDGAGADLITGATDSTDETQECATGESVQFSGFPETVDESVVDVAKRANGFTPLSRATRAFLAEPGGLLVGPDFGSKSNHNPYGENPQGWDAMYDSNGHIVPISPIYGPTPMNYEGPFNWNLPEGGWNMFSMGQGRLEFGNGDQNYTIDLPDQENNNYIVFLRGNYGDLQQNTDKNDTTKVTCYVPGHAIAAMLPSGNTDGGTAFWSAGQAKQLFETSHSSGTNLGDGGASKLTVVYADVNTGAYDVFTQTEGRFEGGNAQLTLVQSNWQPVQ